MKLFLREGSAAHNLLDLLPVLNRYNERWLSLCTDDMNPGDLLKKGSIDHLLRLVLAAGVAPITALRMATLNPAEHYRLWDRGVLAPGRRADLLVVDDLSSFRPQRVYQGGRLVARDARPVARTSTQPPLVTTFDDTVRIDWSQVDFRVPAKGGRLRAIGVISDQLVTTCRIMPARIVEGMALADPGQDLLKMAVIERHKFSGRLGLGFVTGLGLARGAMASTVAHDHHNLLVVGADDESMMTAAQAVAGAGGGQAVALGREVLALLPLPIAGLMSNGSVEQVASDHSALVSAARRHGCRQEDPFMTLSFLALEVIPDIKLTDRGLVDVQSMEFIPLFLED
jgi:adenine deaminase